MSNIKIFESKQVRSVWNEQERKWYFSVQDVVGVLTDSMDVKQYIKKLLSRDEQLKNNWGTICTLVEMEAADEKIRKVQAATAQSLLRIIQSIPSPKAEPFKLWLAQVGSDRLDEIENPELATQRTMELYKLKGYPKKKGRLQVGADADITVFNAATITDKATFEKGLAFSEGVEYVLVNGVLVLSKGKTVAGIFPGQPVYGKFKK